MLHLGHPLVTAAVERARAEDVARLAVRFRVDEAPAALRDAAGSAGRLVLSRLRLAGPEPVERLVVTAHTDGADAPLDPELARALLALPAEELSAGDPRPTLADEELAESVEEQLFVERARLAGEERDRFAARLHRIERSLDDRMLVLRRERAELEARLETTRSARDASRASEARARAEGAMAEVQAELDRVDLELERLAARDDDRYRAAREAALAARFAPVETERLLEAEFALH